MRNNGVVVLFCGPRTTSGHPSTRRITHAIDVAVSERHRLLIVGDAYNGEDLELFASMAKEHDVDQVIPITVPSEIANTKTNAQAVATELAKHAFQSVNRVWLVTDYWHMKRAQYHLAAELKALRGNNVPELIALNVTSSFVVAESVLERESKLLDEAIAASRRTPKKAQAVQA